jgi:hypothetical protein
MGYFLSFDVSGGALDVRVSLLGGHRWRLTEPPA